MTARVPCHATKAHVHVGWLLAASLHFFTWNCTSAGLLHMPYMHIHPIGITSAVHFPPVARALLHLPLSSSSLVRHWPHVYCPCHTAQTVEHAPFACRPSLRVSILSSAPTASYAYPALVAQLDFLDLNLDLSTSVIHPPHSVQFLACLEFIRRAALRMLESPVSFSMAH